jgi:hypothetical protein
MRTVPHQKDSQYPTGSQDTPSETHKTPHPARGEGSVALVCDLPFFRVQLEVLGHGAGHRGSQRIADHLDVPVQLLIALPVQ